MDPKDPSDTKGPEPSNHLPHSESSANGSEPHNSDRTIKDSSLTEADPKGSTLQKRDHNGSITNKDSTTLTKNETDSKDSTVIETGVTPHSTQINGGINQTRPVSSNGVVFEDIPLKEDTGKAAAQGDMKDPPKVEIPVVGFFQLFRYSDIKDRVLMAIGTIAAIANGLAFPLNLLIYGKVLNIFIANEIAKNNITFYQSDPSLISYMNGSTINPLAQASAVLPVWPQVQPLIGWFCLVGCCVLVAGYLEIAFWSWAAERQTRRVRTLFFDSIMKQQIGWFDTHQSGELSTRLADDIVKLNSGIGDKLATLVQWMTTFFAGYVLGFTQNWKLTLVILSVAPIMFITIVVMARTIQKLTIGEQTAYAKAGAIAEETLGNIRTVAAFGGENKEAERYISNLDGARRQGLKRGLASGVGQGMFWVLIFGSFALAFWYGSKLVAEDGEEGGTILQVFMGVMIGTMSLGHAAPNLEYISSARGAAAAVFSVIDQEPEIDSSSEEGQRPEKVEGNVEFVDVDFAYPARPEVQVLEKFNLKVNVGQTVALVGASGCGKSTTIQLLQRFYDPLSGMVKLDGRDIRDLNIQWLRQHIGVVSQEPVLFATTIAENIRYGREGVTQLQIEQAAREANAMDFILKLPDKFNTLVGARGAQLSGGQKQRIAIARALVRNPKILLLDEATSALDTESESIVQDALDKARQGRTTLVIAHRLSTIRNADVIVGVGEGRAIETGTHDELMEIEDGIYHQLVASQTAAAIKEKKQMVDDNITNLLRRLADAKSQDDDEGEEDFELEDPLLTPRSPKSELTRFGSGRFSSHRRPPYSRQQSEISVKSVKSNSGRMRQESVLSDSEVWSDKDEAELTEKLPPAPVKRIMRLNAPEWHYIVIGCISAVFTGAVHPAFSVLFSEILGNFATIDQSKQAQRTAMFSALIASLGFIVAIANVTQQYFFALSGENLTLRLRQMAFRTMLRQDIAWFDDRTNQVGALTARLASDASAVRGATGQQMGVIVQSIMNMGTALIIAFVFGPKLTCVVIAFLPFLVFSGLAQGKLLQGFSKGDKTLSEEGGKIAVESIDNIRTVAALTLEPTIKQNFNSHFDKMYRKGVKKSHVYGIFYSLSQSVVFFAYAATFAYGSQLIDSGDMIYRDVFRVFAAITFGGQAMGRAGSYAPDLTKAKLAAAKLFMLFDRHTAIDSSSDEGLKPETCKGKVSFNNVRFRYPTRMDVEVLQKLNLSVDPGQTLALVGSSGCGKSTTVQLIERFYDTLQGSVTVDGCSVKELNVAWLRSHLGIVSQEPVLFDASIRDNIAYGDNSREVGMDEIITAARSANIHSFIENLPQGYDTNVGDKGAQLSGGQKQRVAIARALVRNPKVLLLDEATSALDTESEHIVQEALDRARLGRTCITIAHRLSTIQNADLIAVIHNGKVLEQGQHYDLMAKQGYYYKLHQAQHRRRDYDQL